MALAVDSLVRSRRKAGANADLLARAERHNGVDHAFATREHEGNDQRSPAGVVMPRQRRRYNLEELLKNADPDALLNSEMQSVLDIPPVGRKFGSGSSEDPARVPDPHQK